ncbi:MAG: hypothetical protein EZS28_011151 [Streblomastix strix]|uniref:Uncharacterized protein n=1 Tax=Streblomastix strix TaxID=222440 RepID=A0A5J4WFN6_9EUKA|nr:MAG: hypothetical protein EZS28_011151 [Streblomastix strix]
MEQFIKNRLDTNSHKLKLEGLLLDASFKQQIDRLGKKSAFEVLLKAAVTQDSTIREIDISGNSIDGDELLAVLARILPNIETINLSKNLFKAVSMLRPLSITRLNKLDVGENIFIEKKSGAAIIKALKEIIPQLEYVAYEKKQTGETRSCYVSVDSYLVPRTTPTMFNFEFELNTGVMKRIIQEVLGDVGDSKLNDENEWRLTRYTTDAQLKVIDECGFLDQKVDKRKGGLDFSVRQPAKEVDFRGPAIVQFLSSVPRLHFRVLAADGLPTSIPVFDSVTSDTRMEAKSEEIRRVEEATTRMTKDGVRLERFIALDVHGFVRSNALEPHSQSFNPQLPIAGECAFSRNVILLLTAAERTLPEERNKPPILITSDTLRFISPNQ